MDKKKKALSQMDSILKAVYTPEVIRAIMESTRGDSVLLSLTQALETKKEE